MLSTIIAQQLKWLLNHSTWDFLNCMETSVFPKLISCDLSKQFHMNVGLPYVWDSYVSILPMVSSWVDKWTLLQTLFPIII